MFYASVLSIFSGAPPIPDCWIRDDWVLSLMDFTIMPYPPGPDRVAQDLLEMTTIEVRFT